MDHWIGYWQVIDVTTPIKVDKEWPVLLRLRLSLTESLTDCPGLSEELVRQPKHYTSRKRVAEIALVSPSPKRLKHTTRRITELPEIDLTADSDNEDDPITQRSVTPRPAVTSDHTSNKSSATAPSLQLSASLVSGPGPEPTPSDSERRWPSQYTLCEIRSGLKRMEDMAQADFQRVTEKSAFPLVFTRCVYKKSTVGRVKRLLSATPSNVLKRYESKTWQLFLKKRKGSTADSSSDEDDNEEDREGNKEEEGLIPASVREPSLEYVTPPPAPIPTTSTRTHAPFPMAPLSPGSLALDLIKYDTLPVTVTQLSRAHSPIMTPASTVPLCEFCDEPIPLHPSQTFLAMREELFKKSRPDPLPCNPNHRRARFTVYHNYCDRHELEMKELPKAQASGWPLDPDFERIYIRVLKLDRLLQSEILGASFDHLMKNVFFERLYDRYQTESSSLAAQGLRSEFENHDISISGAG